MGKDEFVERINSYLEEIRENGKSRIRITKDIDTRKHVCLVDWDELDEISDLENSLTGGKRDYKELDRANIEMIIELINDDEEK